MRQPHRSATNPDADPVAKPAAARTAGKTPSQPALPVAKKPPTPRVRSSAKPVAEGPAAMPAKPAKTAKPSKPPRGASAASPAVAAPLPAAEPAKPAAKSANAAAKTAAPIAADAGAKPARGKQRPVRDSFTMPPEDYALIAQIKDRALGFKRPTKKSELLRAGLQALAALGDAQLQAALTSLRPLPTGRPKKGH